MGCCEGRVADVSAQTHIHLNKCYSLPRAVYARGALNAPSEDGVAATVVLQTRRWLFVRPRRTRSCTHSFLLGCAQALAPSAELTRKER